MAESAKQPGPVDVGDEQSRPTRTPHIMSVLQRPFEFALIGLGIVGVLFIAQQADVLPERFAGIGMELEFDVGELADKSSQEIINLHSAVERLERELVALRDEIQSSATVSSFTSGTSRAATGTQPLTRALEPLALEDQAPRTSNLLETAEIQGQGVVWIGTWDRDRSEWTDQSVRIVPEAQTLPPPADLIRANLELTTSLNVREAFPSNTEAYYREVRALGVADTGAAARVISPPREIDRGSGTQVWAQVELSFRPYLGAGQARSAATSQ